MSIDVAVLGRTFERVPAAGTCHQVKQVPAEFNLPTFETEHAGLHLRLDINLSLTYLAVIDSGSDRFRVTLTLQAPARWQDEKEPGTLVMHRAFISLAQVISWVRQLETVVESALYSDVETGPYAPDQAAIRLLLQAVDYLEALRPQLGQQAAQRQAMLKA